MEFITDLTKEQIRARLQTRATPYTFWNRYTENVYISKWKNEDVFYLCYTGSWWSANSAMVFIGTVEEGEEETVIRGKFGYTTGMMMWTTGFLALFIGFAWIGMVPSMLFSVNSSQVDRVGTIAIMLFWTAAVLCLCLIGPRLISGEGRKEAVIHFINENLVE